MTTRFAGGTSPITIATGNVAAGATFTVDSAISNNFINIAKVKVVPSGSTTGYVLQLFRHATRLAADLMFATKTSVVGNFYTPTSRSGGEVLEGWVLPYEDQDVALQLHVSLTNNDNVARTYTITIEYEDPTVTALSNYNPAVVPSVSGANLVLPTAATAASHIRLYRNGVRMRQGVQAGPTYDYYVQGNLTTLVPSVAIGSDYFEAEYY